MNAGYLAFDIGGTKTFVALADAEGRIIAQERHATPLDLEEGLDLLLATGRRLAGGRKILGAAAAAGGPLDTATGVVSPLHQPQWRNVPLKKIMEEAFGCPFAVDVDTNLGALGEWGAGQASIDRFLYVTVSTGVGGGFLCDGKIYTGFNGVHPEIGHQAVPLHPDAETVPHCPCGAYACLESLVSGNGIRRRFGKPAEQLDEKEWAMVTWELSQGLRNLAIILAPRVISLGGGVVLGRGWRLIEEISAHLERELRLVPQPALRLSTLDALAPLNGAIYLARQAAA